MVPKSYGEQHYGHILDRLSKIDNAQAPFGEGAYNPPSSGYHFPEDGSPHPKPYQKLNRAHIMAEMEHPFTGETLPILLREGNQDTTRSIALGLGNRHAEFRHGNDIRNNYDNAVGHIQDVIENATHLYHDPKRNSFLFVKKIDNIPDNKNLHPTVAVRLDKDNPDHFTTITGYNERWKRIDDGINQFIKGKTNESGIARPIVSQPEYDTAYSNAVNNKSGSPDSMAAKGQNDPSPHLSDNQNTQNSDNVKHIFKGVGAFTGAEMSAAHQNYLNYQEAQHQTQQNGQTVMHSYPNASFKAINSHATQ